LVQKWEESDISVPLKVIASPYREITRPVLEYVKRAREESPRTVVTVFIPEYVVGHWWEQVLHNQSALRLKARLLLVPGVIVASVPYQLKSAGTSASPADRVKAWQAVAAASPRPRPRGLPTTETLQAAELQADVASVKATPIANTHDRDIAVVSGTLRAVTARPRGSSPAVQADLWDGSGSVTLVWLGRRQIPGVEPGRRMVVKGRVATIRGAQTIFNPDYELLFHGTATTE